jgi:hypothetical protein
MYRFTEYYGRFSGIRGNLTGLPSWARAIVAVFAIPALLLAALSLLGFVVSILALLILTAPVYSLLRRLTEPASIPSDEQSVGVRRVESTIVE